MLEARRAPLDIYESFRGSQYLSIRYTERRAEAGIEPSVGSVGDSYDNALAESVIGLYKTESSAVGARGGISKPWNSRHSNGSSGSTTAGCSRLSVMCRQRSLNSSTMWRRRLPS